jgi:SSS family solute:Na+ symporter
MDSQLLTLGSIFSNDLYPVLRGKTARGGTAGRVFVAGLAAAGLLVALTTDATILDLGVTAFTGLAVLFPTVFFGIYLVRPRAEAALASIAVGEAFAVAYHLGLLPAFGFLPAVPVIAASFTSYLLVQALRGGVELPLPRRENLVALCGFAAIFVAAQDFWRWGEVGLLVLGWPIWAWYFVLLSVCQLALTGWWIRRAQLDYQPARPEIPAETAAQPL